MDRDILRVKLYVTEDWEVYFDKTLWKSFHNLEYGKMSFHEWEGFTVELKLTLGKFSLFTLLVIQLY